MLAVAGQTSHSGISLEPVWDDAALTSAPLRDFQIEDAGLAVVPDKPEVVLPTLTLIGEGGRLFPMLQTGRRQHGANTEVLLVTDKVPLDATLWMIPRGGLLSFEVEVRHREKLAAKCEVQFSTASKAADLAPPAIVIEGLMLGMPPIGFQHDPSAYYWLPAHPAGGRRPLAEMDGRIASVNKGGRVAIVHSPKEERSLIAIIHSRQEWATVNVHETPPQGVQFEFWMGCTLQLRPGDHHRVGTAWLGAAAGSVWQGLELCRSMQLASGLQVPEDVPSWARQAALYSAYPGGGIDQLPYRDRTIYRRFAERLRTIRGLGFDAIWFLPFYESDVPGGIYGPLDHESLDPLLGPPSEGAEMVTAARSQGLRVLFDFIPHGPPVGSPLARKNSAFIALDRMGQPIDWFGAYMDYLHPGYQAWCGSLLERLMQRYGTSGFRVDCAAGGPRNWALPRPSLSTFAGGMQMLRYTRALLRRTNPDAIMFAEVTGEPAFAEVADWLYDYPLFHMQHLLREHGSPATWLLTLRPWLQAQTYLYPPHTVLVRFNENHDTYRVRELMGRSSARALLAMTVLLPGIPMVYNGQERGDEDYLHSLLTLRKAQPLLLEGSAEYLAAQCDNPDVLPILRFTPREDEPSLPRNGAVALVLINFSTFEHRARVHLPADWAIGGRREIDTRVPLGGFTVIASDGTTTSSANVAIPDLPPVVQGIATSEWKCSSSLIERHAGMATLQISTIRGGHMQQFLFNKDAWLVAERLIHETTDTSKAASNRVSTTADALAQTASIVIEKDELQAEVPFYTRGWNGTHRTIDSPQTTASLGYDATPANGFAMHHRLIRTGEAQESATLRWGLGLGNVVGAITLHPVGGPAIRLTPPYLDWPTAEFKAEALRVELHQVQGPGSVMLNWSPWADGARLEMAVAESGLWELQWLGRLPTQAMEQALSLPILEVTPSVSQPRSGNP